MIALKRTIQLNSDEIVSVRDEISSKYEELAAARSVGTIKIELSVEEMLLHFQHAYGENAKCTVLLIKTRKGISIEYRNIGDPRNPLEATDDDEVMMFSNSLLARQGMAPVYEYSNKQGTNIVSVAAPLKPKKNRSLILILLAVALAVISGLVIKLFPPDVATYISGTFISPLFSKMTSIISEIATPLVFLAVISGIAGIGSTASLSNIGKKLLKNMGLTYLISGVIFSGLAAIAYGLAEAGTAAEEGLVAQLVQLVLDIIPDNLLHCFVIDNALQVIVIAIFIGVILLSLDAKAAPINDAIERLADVVYAMMSVAAKLMPLIVYLGVFNMLLSDMSGLVSVYKMVILWIVSCALILLYIIIRVKIATKASVASLFKAQLPTLLINLSTSSQVAALPENLKCCKKKFGIDPKLIDFSVPLGITVYMPCGAAFLGLTAWAVAGLSGVPMNMGAVIKICFVAIIVAIAAPPIPGSALTVIPIIFSSCSIPSTYFSVAVILGTVLGYFLPALNGYALQLEVLTTAAQLDKVNWKIFDKNIKRKQEPLESENMPE